MCRAPQHPWSLNYKTRPLPYLSLQPLLSPEMLVLLDPLQTSPSLLTMTILGNYRELCPAESYVSHIGNTCYPGPF